MKYFAIVLIAVCLAACDYLPKNATLNLSPEQISQLQTQLQPSEQVVVDALSTHQFVALGDAHYYPGFMPAISDIITSPKVVSQQPIIVLEFGNQNYQKYINQYIKGDAVDESKLKNVLRETLYFTAWLGDGYIELLQSIRTINQTLPDDKKLTVLLAEKHFNWENATAESWQRAASSKVDGFYDILTPIIQSNQKAILVFGGFHLLKATHPETVNQQNLSLASRIEMAKPNSVFTVWPVIQNVLYDVLPNTDAAKIIKLDDNSVLADIPFRDIMPKARPMLSKINSKDATIQSLADALLYVGHTKRDMTFSKNVINDEKWITEMKKRVAIIGGKLETRFNSLLNDNNVK